MLLCHLQNIIKLTMDVFQSRHHVSCFSFLLFCFVLFTPFSCRLCVAGGGSCGDRIIRFASLSDYVKLRSFDRSIVRLRLRLRMRIYYTYDFGGRPVGRPVYALLVLTRNIFDREIYLKVSSICYSLRSKAYLISASPKWRPRLRKFTFLRFT